MTLTSSNVVDGGPKKTNVVKTLSIYIVEGRQCKNNAVGRRKNVVLRRFQKNSNFVVGTLSTDSGLTRSYENSLENKEDGNTTEFP